MDKPKPPFPTLLLLGAAGQLGFELKRALAPLGYLIALDRQGCDVSDPVQIWRVVETYRPNIIINATGYTAVDRAEDDTALAHCINAEAPAVLAACAQAFDALLVHYSTDYVFDGHAPLPYQENDLPTPLSVYGSSKLAGERAIISTHPEHLIFRTSWVFGVHGANFVKTILRLAQTRDALSVVNDQIGAPTAASLLADVSAHALRTLLQAPEYAHAYYGLYHVSATGYTNWYDYARHIVSYAHATGLALTLSPEAITPLLSRDYPQAATRPAYSRLNCSKFTHAFQLHLPDWKPPLEQVLQVLTQQ